MYNFNNLHPIAKARKVPTVREVIKAAREMLWESVGRIDLGIRRYQEGGEGVDQSKWLSEEHPDSELLDFEELRDTLRGARKGDAPSFADCYVYSTDEFQGLIDNLDLAVVEREWYLLSLTLTERDRFFSGRTVSEGYAAIAAAIHINNTEGGHRNDRQ